MGESFSKLIKRTGPNKHTGGNFLFNFNINFVLFSMYLLIIKKKNYNYNVAYSGEQIQILDS